MLFLHVSFQGLFSSVTLTANMTIESFDFFVRNSDMSCQIDRPEIGFITLVTTEWAITMLIVRFKMIFYVIFSRECL